MRADVMRILQPRDWAEALAARAAHPEAIPIAGGTDVMVAMKLDHLRPEALLDLSGVRGLDSWHIGPDCAYLAAGVTYTTLEERLPGWLSGLGAVAREVGSRQVRNRGTIGGSLGTASSRGDLHPMLLAAGATIELESSRGSRSVAASNFYLGRGLTALAPDELIAGVRVPIVDGAQWFTKIGWRRGVVKPLCSVALVLDVGRERVGLGIGAVGPVPLRAACAEDFLSARLGEARLWRCAAQLPDGLVAEFGRLAALATQLDTDGQASAAYRRHAVAVLAQRGLRQGWAAHRGRGPL
jgi:CO/xanthine dehydrogenase FAD-binding subunit